MKTASKRSPRKSGAGASATKTDATPKLDGSLDGSLGYAIRQAQIRSYQLFAVSMREWDIRPAQYALLVLIHENKGITQSIAGSALGVEKANMAGLLTELHHLGLIERKSLASDRRAYSLHLTAPGRTLIRKLLKRHEVYEQALSSELSPAEREHLLSLLGRLVQATAVNTIRCRT